MFKYLTLTNLLSAAFLVVLSTSCSTPKNTNYFQTIPYNSEVQSLVTKDFEHKVKVDDILQIGIFSPSSDVELYNTAPEGYLVDRNGNIQLYKIGDVRVAGLTLAEVKDKIAKLLMPDYLKQVSVSARFKSHKVVVLGDVASPGVIPMETEQISLLEALSLRGDLKETAKRDNVLIIRNTDRGKLFYRVNLLDGSLFNSNFYYLRADDIVYVEPEKKKREVNTAQIVGFVISGLSLAILLFDRIYQ